jgi:hypothetical protein
MTAMTAGPALLNQKLRRWWRAAPVLCVEPAVREAIYVLAVSLLLVSLESAGDRAWYHRFGGRLRYNARP